MWGSVSNPQDTGSSWAPYLAVQLVLELHGLEVVAGDNPFLQGYRDKGGLLCGKEPAAGGSD